MFFRNYLSLVRLLFRYKLISGYHVNKNNISVLLKYNTIPHSVLNNIKIISKPGHRIFITKHKLQRLQYIMEPQVLFLLQTKFGLLFINKKNFVFTGGELLAIFT